MQVPLPSSPAKRRHSLLRRAHSEELVSEVGLPNNSDENNNKNSDHSKKRSFDNGVEVLPDFFAAKLQRGNRRSSEEEEEEGEERPPLQVSDRPTMRVR